MAKSKEKNKALDLRQEGQSIKEIAKKLKIAKSTVSLWCRDIELTAVQVKRLHERMVKGGYEGRMAGARAQYEQRLKRTKELKKQGRERLGKLSARDFLTAGLALYWGEGSKNDRQGVRISNSDPKIVKFILKWFRKVWNIPESEIGLAIIINKIHKYRVREVEEYWSKTTKIPQKQFSKTTLIKSKNRKNYKNFPIHYGVVTVRIRKSTGLHRQILGMLEGLAQKI